MRLACAGFFLMNGLNREETTSVMKSVVEANGPHDKGDELKAIETTLNNINRKQHVTGRATFIELIDKYGHPDYKYGNRIISEIIRLLGGSEFLENKGKIISNQENIRRAMEIGGVQFSYNEFSGKSMVHYPGDNNGNSYTGEVEDNIRRRIWLEIERKYSFLPRKDLCYDVMDDLSWENKFHPILQYLKELKWDGVPRIDTWVINSAKADDNLYVRAVSSIMLMAAIKRVTQPGCKFDEMVVFESGTQGLMKSTALRTLCPNEEWFSDNLPLNLKPQELIESTAGKWIIEASELNKIRATQMEQIKGLLSRQEDMARLAYRHDAKNQRRQFIIVGTTNSYNYLTDQTGNRRFWPVRVQKFDISWLRENRDQLWAEAYTREQGYTDLNGEIHKPESIRLPEELYQAAEDQQSHRLVDDDWRNALDLYFEDQYQRVAYDEIWEQLAIPLERRNAQTTSRLAEVMQSLGFVKASTVRNRNGKVSKGWKREVKHSDKEWNKIRGHEEDLLGKRDDENPNR
jgi:predicted P-loop ATPase